MCANRSADTILITGDGMPTNEIGVIIRFRKSQDWRSNAESSLPSMACQPSAKIPVDLAERQTSTFLRLARTDFTAEMGGRRRLLFAAPQSRVQLSAVIDGGGHERGMRSGTLNVRVSSVWARLAMWQQQKCARVLQALRAS